MKKHSMLLALITCAGLAPTIPTHASPQTVHALGYVSAGALLSISAERLISLIGSERKYMQLKRILANKTSSERDKAITRLILSSAGITVAVIIALITGRYHVMHNKKDAKLTSQPRSERAPEVLPRDAAGVTTALQLAHTKPNSGQSSPTQKGVATNELSGSPYPEKRTLRDEFAQSDADSDTSKAPTPPVPDPTSARMQGELGAAPTEEPTTAVSRLDTTGLHMRRAKSADSPRMKPSCYTVSLNGSSIVATSTGSTESSPSSIPSASPVASPIRAGAGSGVGGMFGTSTMGSPTTRLSRFKRLANKDDLREARTRRKAKSVGLIEKLDDLNLTEITVSDLFTKNTWLNKELSRPEMSILQDIVIKKLEPTTFKTLLTQLHSKFFIRHENPLMLTSTPHQAVLELLNEALEKCPRTPPSDQSGFPSPSTPTPTS